VRSHEGDIVVATLNDAAAFTRSLISPRPRMCRRCDGPTTSLLWFETHKDGKTASARRGESEGAVSGHLPA
jgi:hypothetical protein